MKKNLKIVTLCCLASFLIISCGSKETDGSTVQGENKANSETSGEAKKVNTNLSLTMTDTPIEKLGLTLGLPAGWSFTEPTELMDMITCSVKSGGTEVFYIESSATKQDNPGLASMLEAWDNTEKYSVLEKEENTAFDGGSRTGLVVWKKKTDNKAREVVFDYFITLNGDKIKFAKFYPTDKTYNCNSIDTCIAIIKSIKLKK